jgi:D-alanyl-D-alanine carboxypeptidase
MTRAYLQAFCGAEWVEQRASFVNGIGGIVNNPANLQRTVDFRETGLVRRLVKCRWSCALIAVLFAYGYCLDSQMTASRWVQLATAIALSMGFAFLLSGPKDSGDALDRAVNAVLEAGPVGAVVAFDTGKGGVDVRAFGRLADMGAPERLRFRLASLTKPVVAAAVLELVAQDRVSLDARLSDVLPEFAIEDPRAVVITLRDLLRHSSGIDERAFSPLFMPVTELEAAFGLVASDMNDCAPLAAAILARPLEGPPQTAYRYSNTGYCLLGLLIGSMTGLPLDEALAELMPEAANLSFDLSTLDVEGAVLPGQDVWLVRNPDVVAGAGGLIGSAADFLAFLARPVAEDVMRKPDYALDETHFYGLGWRVWPGVDCPARTHFGSMPGAYSVAVVHEDGRRFVALFEGRPEEDWGPFATLTSGICSLWTGPFGP